MLRKPIILIMTSRDEPTGLSGQIAGAINEFGTHNAVVLSDDKYGSAAKLSALDRLMDSGSEYRYLLERKDKGVIKDKLTPRKFSKRVNRIKNMLKRFNPEYVLCVTPYAHHCAAEAKRKLRSDFKLIYMLTSMTVSKSILDDMTDVYIVENAEAKADLIRLGVRSKSIMTLGLPFDVERLPREEREENKRELGLPKEGTIFVNLNDKSLLDVMPLLLDQGDIANLVVYTENPKLMQTLGAEILAESGITAIFVKSKDKVDEYLQVSDMAITGYDISLIYRCMRLGVAPIIYTRDEHAGAEVSFLVNHGLCLRAKEDIDIIGLEYKLLQTDFRGEIAENGMKWTELNSLKNIAGFLVSYIAV